MIKRILSIKNFGVFQAYINTSNTPDFKNVNIIYGWNYSGKTTLSRVIQTMEKKSISKNYSMCEFNIMDSQENIISHSGIADSNKIVRVFNSDFINSNLKWDGENFDPILLLGSEAIEAKKKLEDLERKSKKIHSQIKKRTERHGEIKSQISQQFSAKASEIKKVLGIVEAFRSDHLNTIYRGIEKNIKINVLPNDIVSRTINEATSNGPQSQKLKPVSINLNLEDLEKEVVGACKLVPEFTETIEFLKNHPQIASWVETGLSIHDDTKNCFYCENIISETRKSTLLAHFSDDLRSHKDLLSSIALKIKAAKEVPNLPHDSQVLQSLRTEYATISNEVKLMVAEYNNYLDFMLVKINEKYSLPFTSIEISITPKISDNLKQAFLKLNSFFEEQNRKIDSFYSEKESAIKKMKYHYISEFAINFDLQKKEIYLRQQLMKIERLMKINEKNQKEISILEATLSKAQRGSEELNQLLEKFLGIGRIRIRVSKSTDQKEHFTLIRGNEHAVNLSEGEKTAVALSYFLVKLREITDLKNTIVYVDDPISSLDSNHIFQVKAVLKDFFFTPNEGREWTLNCAQLFLSTHNFEFFSLLRKLPVSKNSSCFYQIRRIDASTSTLEQLPNSLKNFPSEYHFLFNELYNFYQADNKAEYHLLMHIPNAVRRFVELYTYAKIPGDSSSTVDRRMDILFGIEKSKRIMKVLHYFSHGGTLERLMNNSDLMSDISGAVDDLIKELESKDTLHFEALKAAMVG